MLVAFSVAPSGAGESMSEVVAEAVRVVRESGLSHETNAMFTLVEGEYDEVMAVVKRAVDAVAARAPGEPRAQGRHPGRGERPTARQGGRRRAAAWRCSSMKVRSRDEAHPPGRFVPPLLAGRL